jgi:hypothetical protein
VLSLAPARVKGLMAARGGTPFVQGGANPEATHRHSHRSEGQGVRRCPFMAS